MAISWIIIALWCTNTRFKISVVCVGNFNVYCLLSQFFICTKFVSDLIFVNQKLIKQKFKTSFWVIKKYPLNSRSQKIHKGYVDKKLVWIVNIKAICYIKCSTCFIFLIESYTNLALEKAFYEIILIKKKVTLYNINKKS